MVMLIKKTTAAQRDGGGYAYAGLDVDGFVKKVVQGGKISGDPEAGLNLASQYLGYFSGEEWTVYISSDGRFAFKGSAGHYIIWDGTTLEIKGDMTGGKITGTVFEQASGAVVIDAQGIRVEGTEHFRFTDGDNLYGEIAGDIMGLRVAAKGGTLRQLWLQVEDAGGVATYILTTQVFQPPGNGEQNFGTTTHKWDTIYRVNESACPLPTANSAIEVIRKIKKPELRDLNYGKRHYFMDEDFPDEMKFINDEGKPDIELTRTLGVCVQAIRELIGKIDVLETKIAPL